MDQIPVSGLVPSDFRLVNCRVRSQRLKKRDQRFAVFLGKVQPKRMAFDSVRFHSVRYERRRNVVVLPPDFPRYRAVSRQVREILQRHTDLIEPLSLDEAYLDVSENKTGLLTATLVARTIREQIRTELQLTASAGVAPNKFLAKIASD